MSTISPFQRAHRVLRTEGVIETVKKSISYITRSTVHKVGLVGFYNSNLFLKGLVGLNGRSWRYNYIGPWTIINVDPDEIEFVTGRGPFPGRFRWTDIGTIKSGDWDQSDDRVANLPVVKGLRKRFEEGRDWNEIDEIQEPYDQIEELYSSIAINGYRPRSDLEESNRANDIPPRFEPYAEVAVDIGRDGNYLFVDGRHRLAIAKILDVDTIPVRVVGRHSQWQKIREQAIEGISEESDITHPDIQAYLQRN